MGAVLFWDPKRGPNLENKRMLNDIIVKVDRGCELWTYITETTLTCGFAEHLKVRRQDVLAKTPGLRV